MLVNILVVLIMILAVWQHLLHARHVKHLQHELNILETQNARLVSTNVYDCIDINDDYEICKRHNELLYQGHVC